MSNKIKVCDYPFKRTTGAHAACVQRARSASESVLPKFKFELYQSLSACCRKLAREPRALQSKSCRFHTNIFSSVNNIFRLMFISSVALVLLFTAARTYGQSQGQKIFESRCYSCHNIGGGDKQGPDLKGVTDRRTKEWMQEFIKAPQTMSGKDPAAAELFKKFSPTVMPDQQLTPEEFDAIISLIKELAAKNEMFVPSGAKLSRAIVPADIQAGWQIFTGKTKLTNGAASCNSCHSVNGVGAFGGGTLGPDLTAANIKYRDPELISILQNPNFPTMKGIFDNRKLTDEEIVQLFAYLQHAKQTNPQARVVPTQAAATIEPRFLILGFGATTFALIGLNVIWRKRHRGVRQDLVRRSKI